MRFFLAFCGLLLASLIRSVPLIENKEIRHGEISDSQRQILLYRLQHADGDQHQLNFFKMVLSSQNTIGTSGGHENCIRQLIDMIERIVVWSAITGCPETTTLRQAKLYTEQLIDVEANYKTKLCQLPEPIKTWYGISMNELIYGFLNYESKELYELQLELLLSKNRFKTAWPKVCEIAAYCAAALQSGIKTTEILREKREGTMRRLASWLHLQYNSKSITNPFKDTSNPLGKRDGNSSSRNIAADIKYLRQGISATIKAGIFLLLCFQYQLYLCSVAFGFLISISCFLWISIYLEMVADAL